MHVSIASCMLQGRLQHLPARFHFIKASQVVRSPATDISDHAIELLSSNSGHPGLTGYTRSHFSRLALREWHREEVRAAGLAQGLPRPVYRAGELIHPGRGGIHLELTVAQDWDGTWYAFATSDKPNGAHNIQVARANSPKGPWTWLDHDALPNTGKWTTGVNNVSNPATFSMAFIV